MGSKDTNYNVCFVCTGNASRSPFAECVTRELLRRNNIDGINVYSLGTYNWGSNPRSAAMVETARNMGYTLTGTTTFITREALLRADIIIVFQADHRTAITYELDYDHWDRIVMFDKIAFGTDTEVEDPHFQSAEIHNKVARHIEEGCKNLVESWKETPPK